MKKPLEVLDFRCDVCGKKMDAILLAKAGIARKIAKSYHEECWNTSGLLEGIIRHAPIARGAN